MDKMLAFYVIIFLPTAYAVEFTSLSSLNTDDILFRRQHCLLFLFAMTSEDTKDAHLSSEYGTYSIDNPKIKKPDTYGFFNFDCIIGIAYFDQVLPFQNLLIWCKTKQMLLLEKTKNVSSTLQANTLEGKIDRRHHPLLVLRQSVKTKNMEQVVICRGARLQKTINRFILDKWVVAEKSYSMMLERQCNNGNHMLHGKKLVAGAFGVAPYIFYNSNRTEVTGVAVDLAKVIAERLHFGLSFLPENSSITKVDFRTMKASGALADVSYGKADFTVQSALGARNFDDQYQFDILYGNNSGAYDFTNPHYQSNYYFATYYPGKKKPFYNLVRIFDAATWLLTLISLVAATLVYSIVCRLTKGESVWDTAWVAYGILFQEFHDYNSKKATKVSQYQWQDIVNMEALLKLLWTVASFLLVIAFGSQLKSQLAVQDYEDSLDNLEELLADGRPIYISEDIQLLIIFQLLGGDIGQWVSKHATAGGHVIEQRLDADDVMLGKVLTEKGAALSTPEYILFDQGKYMRKGKEYPMHIVPEVFAVQHISYILIRYSPMTNLLNDMITKVPDTGIINRILDRWSPFRGFKNQRPKTSSNNKLVLPHLAIPLVFCFAGLVLSTLCFIGENILLFMTEFRLMSRAIVMQLAGFRDSFNHQLQAVRKIIRMMAKKDNMLKM